MALDHCADIIVKMQEAQNNGLNLQAALYFDKTFKPHFRQLERSIINNWRLHKAFYHAQGLLSLTTKDENEVKDIVQMMLNMVKGKTCSLPVKKFICEKLA